MFLSESSESCFLLRAEGFSCSLDAHCGGLGISNLQFLINKIFLFMNPASGSVFSLKCWIRIRRYSMNPDPKHWVSHHLERERENGGGGGGGWQVGLVIFHQGFGSGSGLDPYSIGPVDPDPDPDSESGSGSRRPKITHKSRKKLVEVHVLKCWMASFESWRLLLQLGHTLWRLRDR
jgi:hypothetical protein